MKAARQPTVAILLGAGIGSRFGGTIKKQYLEYNNKAPITLCIDKFLYLDCIDFIQIAIHKDDLEAYQNFTRRYKATKYATKLLPYVFGGNTRQESSKISLNAISHINPGIVLIHDIARPFVSERIILEVCEKLNTNKDIDAVDVALNVTDTVKMIDENDNLVILDREKITLTQTPQGFRYKIILDLHNKNTEPNMTDDLSLCIKSNFKIASIKGDKKNIKITTRDDMTNNMLPKIATGMGFDAHKFGDEMPECKIPICGVMIDSSHPILAHSDGDVGLHALIDALLGAICAHDIGYHFPSSDSRYKNISSAEMLSDTMKLLDAKGATISHLDITLICAIPKIAPHKEKMRNKISAICNIPLQSVSVKATTTDGMGFTGRAEGIAAQAICTLCLFS